MSGADQDTQLVTMLAEYFTQLHLSEKAAVSIEQLEEDYVLHMHSQPCSKCSGSAKVAISSAANTVRLFSRSNLAYTGTIQAHEEIVTGVKFSPENHELLYSSSRDGSIRCWDMRRDFEKPCQKFQGMLTGDEGMLAAFDINSDGHLLCAGTDANKDGDSHLLFWDTRKSDVSRTFSDCHNEDITAVCFHPELPNSLVSAASDGLVNLFDLSQTNEDDAILTSFNAEASANVVGWCGEKLDKVYSITHGETLHIWDSKEFDDILCLTDIKEKFKEGTVTIDYLVDCVAQIGSELPCLLAGSHSGQLLLFSIVDSELKHTASLSDGHKDDVRCISWDSQSHTLITGGDDGMLCLWSTGGTPMSVQKKPTNKAKSKLKKGRGPVTAGGRPYHKK